jgi:hypothetical protein
VLVVWLKGAPAYQLQALNSNPSTAKKKTKVSAWWYMPVIRVIIVEIGRSRFKAIPWKK